MTLIRPVRAVQAEPIDADDYDVAPAICEGPAPNEDVHPVATKPAAPLLDNRTRAELRAQVADELTSLPDEELRATADGFTSARRDRERAARDPNYRRRHRKLSYSEYRTGGYQLLIRKAAHVRPIAFMVLLRIYDQSVGMSRGCWRGTAAQFLAGVRDRDGEQLVDPLPISRATLFRALDELAGAGLLRRHNHGHGLDLVIALPLSDD